MCVYLYIHMHIYIYIHIHICLYVYICMYVYMDPLGRRAQSNGQEPATQLRRFLRTLELQPGEARSPKALPVGSFHRLRAPLKGDIGLLEWEV